MRKALLALTLLALAALAYTAGLSRGPLPRPGAEAERPPATAPARQPAERGGRRDIGFASQQKLVEHFRKHGGEFGAPSAQEYLRRAQELRDRPAGDKVLEHVREDGVVTRFDRADGAFLAFDADLTIRTFFVPHDGEAYFRRQSRREAK